MTGDRWAALAIAQHDLLQRPRDSRIVSVARDALREQALAALPLSVIAVQSAHAGEAEKAKAFALLAERVSRRDLIIQLLLIEQSVAANDYVGALRHYDVALRTHEISRPTLFPILAGALSDDAIRQALVPYVRPDVAWMDPFVTHAARQGAAKDIARLLIAADNPRARALMQTNSAAMFTGLAQEGHLGEARELLRRLPGANLAALASAGFNATTVDQQFGALAWAPVVSDASSVSFENATNSVQREARVIASFGERGVALRRVLQLAPGPYRFSETRDPVVNDGNSRAWWDLKCMRGTETETIWRSADAPIAQKGTVAVGPMVPQSCAAQVLELNYIAGENSQGLEFVVRTLDFTR
ncbi:hypothetical protein FHS95_000956 [Sphingomonas naasensis]|uniref:Uncharacterized protein n=1 Tax=Sphingomonas naasensis TaxID=1344951 RepID=A0A4V3QXH6_9SPHN|nr:hypothetical protein [Sphingomonas naasensis]NIJ19287.1 hypothetical protein [Sphingomonas naasensis]TGX46462.1 hypothetical protein E5A74_04765 [Sphingomonas naasensis]